MQLFADDAQLTSLEAAIDSPGGSTDAARVALAWYLRHRDTRRAIAMADELAVRLGWAAADNTRLLARLDLLRAEAAVLFTQFAAATSHIDTARAAFAACKDSAGVGDTHLVAALLANAQGDVQGHWHEAKHALKYFEAAHDDHRIQIATAWVAAAGVYAKPSEAKQMVAAARALMPSPIQPAQVLLGQAESFCLFNIGEYAQAAIDGTALIAPAEQFGMRSWQIRIGNMVSAAFGNLDDRESAIHWVEQSLSLARLAGWPVSLGDTLALLGSLTHEAGHYERSLTILREAASWLKQVPDSRSMALVNCYLSQANHAAGHFTAALHHAQEAARIAEKLHAFPVIADAHILAGRAHACLGQGDIARQEILTGLALTERHHLPFWQVGALRALAELDERYPNAESQPLKHLEKALEVVNSMGGHSDLVELLEALSRCYERAGDLAQALAFDRQARTKSGNAESRRVANQLVALSLRHKTEQQRMDAEHQRHLAEAQAARALELEASMQVLENLGEIGREITANLNLSNVLRILVSRLNKLMTVTFVGLSVLEPNGKEMIRRGFENGQPVPDRCVPLDAHNSQTALCARERREVLVDLEVGAPIQPDVLILPGTAPVLACWFGPLLVGDELLGVLSIQSETPHAYGPREMLIFRTLSAYVAVAVANARAYAKLGEQHTKLLKAEAEMRRLATTDALTGIPNRRQFLSTLNAESRRSQRHQRAIAVIMADVDFFKRVNDTLGHSAGDAVLVHVARLLDTHKRAVDTVGRLGGEEFAILLPETSIEDAADVADRLRRVVERELVLWQGNSIAVTVSFGCAAIAAGQLAGNAEQAATELLQAADRALYHAKHAGRNQTFYVRGGDSTPFATLAN